MKRGLSAAAMCLLIIGLLVGCGGGGSATSDADTATVSVAARVDSGELQSESAAGTTAEIASIELTITDNGTSNVIYSNVPLTWNGSSWVGSFSGLIIGTNYTFSAVAYNSGHGAIFSGTTVQTIITISDTVAITMAAVDDGQYPIPVIQSIVRPGAIEEGTTAQISFNILGNAYETLTYEISPVDFNIDPSNGSIYLDATNYGTIVVNFSAPAGAVTTYSYTIKLTNSRGNWISTDFTVTTVNNIVDTGLDISQFNPIVLNVGGKRINSDTVEWTATVTDDGPVGEITYNWQFSEYAGGYWYPIDYQEYSNPSYMHGYSEWTYGYVYLTITDHYGSGGSTQIGIYVPQGQFPDTVVVSTGE